MTFYQDIENYIEGLCRKHKQIRHEYNGTAFLPMGINNELTIVRDLKPLYVRMIDVSASSQNEQLSWVVQMMFLVNLPVTQSNRDMIDEASKITQEIMYEFDARIRTQVDESCSFITRMLNSTMEPAGLTDQSAFGWTYTWRFNTSAPDHNVNAWEE